MVILIWYCSFMQIDELLVAVCFVIVWAGRASAEKPGFGKTKEVVPNAMEGNSGGGKPTRVLVGGET